MTTWSEPIPFREALDDGAPHIVEMLAAVGVDLDVDRVQLLISLAQQAHRRALSAWSRGNDLEHMAPPDRGPYARWINRRPGNSGRFRDGSRLPRAPLAAIYSLCNQFYRRETGLPFHPNFEYLKWDEDFTLTEQRDMLKGAALFFTLIAGEVDLLNYTPQRCALVHDGNYKKLNKRIP